jgi:uncharacterized protein YecT (DUF1311 family)
MHIALRLAAVCVVLLLAWGAVDRAAAKERELERALQACLAAASAATRALPSSGLPEESQGAQAYLRRVGAGAAVNPERCVGYAAEICMRMDEDGSSTLGMAACVGRERMVWEERLNASYRKLMAKASAPARDAYRKSERAWMAYRNAACAIPTARLGTQDRVVPLTTGCFLDLTARQALWIDSELAELE